MISTREELKEFFDTLNEESSHSWTLHYNCLLNTSLMEEWERKSIEDLIRFNKFFDI